MSWNLLSRWSLTRKSRSQSGRSINRRIFFEPLEARRVLTVPTIAFDGGGTGEWQLDESFGLVQADVSLSDDGLFDVAIDGDGKIVSVGQTSSGDSFVVTRTNADGSPDASFGTSGVVVVPFGGFAVGRSVAIFGDFILIAGQVDRGDGPELAIARLEADGIGTDGTLDTTFGIGGRFIDTLPPLPGDVTGTGGMLEDIAIDTVGRVVAVGTVQGFGDWFVARISTDGTYDESFGNLGAVQFDAGATFEEATSVAIQTDDNIVVGGLTVDGDFNTLFAAARFLPNGAADLLFGDEGKATLPANGQAYDIALQSDPSDPSLPPKIVIVGSIGMDNIGLARFTAAGQPDVSFGVGGLVVSDLGDTEQAYDVAAQGDGKLIVAGTRGELNRKLLVVRYNEDGTPDTTFAPSGFLEADFASGEDAAQAVALHAGGIVLAGRASTNSEEGENLALARFAMVPTGSLAAAEGELLVVTGTYSDDGTAPPQIVIDWGDGSPDTLATLNAAAGTFSASHAYADNNPAANPVDTYVITAQITDDELLTASATTSAVIGNEAPVAAPVGAASGGVRYQTLAISGSFTDAGSADTHTVTIDWADGSLPETVFAVAGTFAATHAYAASGTYVATFTVTDDDGGSHAVTKELTVVAAQLQPAAGGGTSLAVGGTSAGDVILVSPVTGGLQVSINSVIVGVYAPTQGTVVYAGDGNDEVRIASSISASAWLYGGLGNDRLKGGGGNDVILGQEGDDLLVGGAGRELIIGGVGADRIIGDAGDDILIAGTTDYDQDGLALGSVMAEWTSANHYYVRVLNLTFGSALLGGQNGPYVLTDNTVHDDGVRDVLTGAAGFDWYFANFSLFKDDSPVKDQLTDLNWWELAMDIDFINA